MSNGILLVTPVAYYSLRAFSGYAPPPGAPIITLSTCTYEFDNAKFVLHAYIEQVIEKE